MFVESVFKRSLRQTNIASFLFVSFVVDFGYVYDVRRHAFTFQGAELPISAIAFSGGAGMLEDSFIVGLDDA